MTKILLFDLDGVLALPEEVFSVIYSRSHEYDLAPFTHFFETEWADFVTGKKDLKQHIENNPQFWKWDKSAEELLDFWFTSEDVKNDDLLKLIEDARRNGFKCYIATEQEQYRTDYIRNVMFKNNFDGVFSTAEIGFKKKDPRFFESLLNSLDVHPADSIYFDDSQSKLDAAKATGIQAYLYEHPDQVAKILDMF